MDPLIFETASANDALILVQIYGRIGRGWPYVVLAAALGSLACAPSDVGQSVEERRQAVSTASVAQTVFVSTFPSVALGASDWIEIGDRVKVTDPAAGVAINTGAGTLGVGVDAVVGPVFSDGPIDLRDRATVKGVARSATSIARGQSANVEGGSSVGSNGTKMTLSIPAKDLGTFLGDVRLEPNQTRTLPPGVYGKILLKQNSVIKLTSGSYLFAQFTGDTGSRLEFDSQCGGVQIAISGNVFLFRSSLRETSGAAGAGLTIAYSGSATAHIEAPFTGQILAPNAELILNAARHEGRFFAKGLRVQAGATIVPEFAPFAVSYCATGGAQTVAGPYCEAGLCCPSPNATSHVENTSTCNSGVSSACVVGSGSPDSNVDTQIFFARGGDDILNDNGSRRVLIGGDGNDSLCASGPSLLWGGNGDDSFRTRGTGTVVAPGPGRDKIVVESGSAQVTTLDECELAGGDTIESAAGSTVTIATQLTAAELSAKAVVFPANATVIFTPADRCKSKCAGAPTCAPTELCVDSGPDQGMHCASRDSKLAIQTRSFSDLVPDLESSVRVELEAYIRRILAGETVSLAPNGLRSNASALIPARVVSYASILDEI